MITKQEIVDIIRALCEDNCTWTSDQVMDGEFWVDGAIPIDAIADAILEKVTG